MRFALLYRAPCGVWYVYSHKLYDVVDDAREAAGKFLTPGTPIAIMPVVVDPAAIEFVQWK